MKDNLLDKRVIIIEDEINDANATKIIEELIDLNNSSDKDIYIFLNCPGGNVTSCVAIYDTLKWCNCDINTICLGHTYAFGTVFLASGTKGKRYAFQDSFIAPTLYVFSDRPEGIYSEESKLVMSALDKVIEIQSINTGIEFDSMKAACLIKHALTSSEAKDKGFIDIIIEKQINRKRRIPFIKSVNKIDYMKTFHTLHQLGILK